MSLREAIQSGNVERTQEVLAAGADPNAADEGGTPALHVAAAGGSAELVGMLLASGADVEIRESSQGATALHAATLYGHLDTVQTLLVYGADVNAVTNSGATPLHLAAQAGHTRVIELLLASGADPNKPDDQEQRTPLHFSAIEGHADCSRLLVWSGAEIEVRDFYGATALWLAATDGKAETVDTLLTQGADVNAANAYGETPLMAALIANQREIVDLLIANCADVNLHEDRHGSTALHIAASYGDIPLLEKLIASGADLTATDHGGATAADAAAAAGHSQAAKLLNPGATASDLPVPGDQSSAIPALPKGGALRLATDRSPAAANGEVQNWNDARAPQPPPFPSLPPLPPLPPLEPPAAVEEKKTPAVTQPDEPEERPAPRRRRRRSPLRILVPLLLAVVGAGGYVFLQRPDMLPPNLVEQVKKIELPGVRPAKKDIPQVATIPIIESSVNDLAGILDQETTDEVASLVAAARKKPGAEIVVVTVDTIRPFTAADFAAKIDKAWKKNRGARENGVVFVIAINESTAGIHVGSRFASRLSPKKIEQLLKKEILTLFEIGEPRAGILAGTRAIKRVLAGEPDFARPESGAAQSATGSSGEGAQRRIVGGLPATILSQPLGAVVIIDRGAFIGRTPFNVTLPRGKHTVEVRMPGYVTEHDKIWVGQENMSYTFNLVPVLD